MPTAKPAECPFCGGHHIDPKGGCLDCGRETQQVGQADPVSHRDWYALEKRESEREQKAREQGKVARPDRPAEHRDWYDIAGTSPDLPPPTHAPPNPTATNAAMAMVAVLVVLLLGAVGYLYFSAQSIPVGPGTP